MSNIRREGSAVLLCCGKGRCPALAKSEDKESLYSLSDDFGGKVHLSKDQLLAIQEAVKELDNS